ncbi:MAG: DinB family protein [Dehalococcoidia bacterium]
MPTRDEYLQQPPPERLSRLARTPDDLAAAIDAQGDATLSRRSAFDGWSARDVICHLRDVEELSILRFHLMLASDDPKVFVVGAPPPDGERWGIGGDVPFPLDPERWVEERQYDRSDAALALAAFRRRRGEALALLDSLSPGQWQRGSIHPERGRITFEEWTAGIASHDDNHLEQLRRALAAQS